MDYVASLSAAISGQVGDGIGIVIGSNIYTIAVILAMAAFASPTRHGYGFRRKKHTMHGWWEGLLSSFFRHAWYIAHAWMCPFGGIAPTSRRKDAEMSLA